MTSADDPDLTALATVTKRIAESVRTATADQRRAATPCVDWDLTALIDHVTGGNWFTASILAGGSAEAAMASAAERFGGASATTEDALHSLSEQMESFLRSGVLGRTWSHVMGDLTGRQILRLRVHDLVVHSWDIDEALQPGATLSEDLASWGLDELDDDDSLTAQHFGLEHRSGRRPSNADWTSYLGVFGRKAVMGGPIAPSSCSGEESRDPVTSSCFHRPRSTTNLER